MGDWKTPHVISTLFEPFFNGCREENLLVPMALFCCVPRGGDRLWRDRIRIGYNHDL